MALVPANFRLAGNHAMATSSGTPVAGTTADVVWHSLGPAVPAPGRRAAKAAVLPETGERIDWMEPKAQDMETGHEYDRRDAARN